VSPDTNNPEQTLIHFAEIMSQQFYIFINFLLVLTHSAYEVRFHEIREN